MLEAAFHDGSHFKMLVEAMKDLFQEVNFDFHEHSSEDGIGCQAMDSSHVCLCTVSLPKSLFSEYRCDEDKTMGLKMDTLSKILKCAGRDEAISLKSAVENSSNLTLNFEKGDERNSTFEMKLIDIDSEHLGIPDSEYDVEVTLPSSEMSRICRDLSQFGDSVTIKCDQEKKDKTGKGRSRVTFSCAGDLGTGTIVLYQSESIDDDKKNKVQVQWPGVTVKKEEGEDNDEEEIAIDQVTPIHQTYAMRFLIYFCKAGSLSDQVKLSISSSLPLTVEYKIGNPDGEEQCGSVKYFLAPKIDEDNDGEDDAIDLPPADSDEDTKESARKRKRQIEDDDEDAE